MANHFWGTYLGTDAAPAALTRRTISTGCGFNPKYIWISRINAGTMEVVFSSSGLQAIDATNGATANFNGSIRSGANGGVKFSGNDFIIGHTNNELNKTFNYFLIEDDTTYMCEGTYVGNSTARNINTGQAWTPTAVWIFISGTGGLYSATIGGDNSIRLGAQTAGLLTNRITGVGAGTFSLGTAFETNNTGSTFYFVCLADKAGVCQSGNYTRDGADNRTISVGGMQVDLAIIMGTGTGIVSLSPAFKEKGITGDLSFIGGVVLEANGIQKIYPDVATDFQVGNNDRTNTTVITTANYPWTVFGPTAAPPLPEPTLPGLMPGGGPSMLPFAPYQRYKQLRSIGQKLNNVVIGP